MENLDKMLSELAAKLNVTVDMLWRTLVRQATIEFIVGTIQWLIVIGLTAFWLIKFIPTLQKKEYKIKEYGEEKIRYWDKWDCWENENRHGLHGTVFVVTAIILSIFLIIGFCSLNDYFASAFNPQYWALKKILGR